MAHFIPADEAFTCHECGEEQRRDALKMLVVMREPKFGIGRFFRTSVPLCYECGVFWLESQDHPIERKNHALQERT